MLGAQYSFGIFFKPVLNEFGWTRAATSGAYSVNSILYGVFSVTAGRLCDRFGPRLVVTTSGFLIGLGYLLMSQTSAIWQVYLFYGVLVSIGMSGCWVPLLSTTAKWFIKRRGLASGIAVSGVGVGIIIMPPLANQLISSYGWRTSYIIIGLIVLAGTVISAQFIRRDPSQMGLIAYGADTVKVESPHLQVHGFSLQEAIRTRQFWMICVMFLCANFCLQTVIVHLVPYATDIGVSATAAATVLSVIGVVSIGSKIGAGSIADRTGSKRVMIVVSILMSASFLWLQSTSELWMLYVFAVVFGLAYGSFVSVQSPMVAEFFGLRAHGAILGPVVFAANIGGAIGSLVAGRIFDISGSYYWAFVLCAILGATSLILSILLRAVRNSLGVTLTR